MTTLADLESSGVDTSKLDLEALKERNTWTRYIRKCNQPSCPGSRCQICHSKVLVAEKTTSPTRTDGNPSHAE